MKQKFGSFYLSAMILACNCSCGAPHGTGKRAAPLDEPIVEADPEPSPDVSLSPDSNAKSTGATDSAASQEIALTKIAQEELVRLNVPNGDSTCNLASGGATIVSLFGAPKAVRVTPQLFQKIKSELIKKCGQS